MEQKEKLGSKSKEAGFTLIELIVAIAILTVGLLAVGSMQISGIGGNLSAYRTSEAVTLAQDRLERLIFVPFADPLLDVGNNKVDPWAPAPAGYAITYDVTNVGAGVTNAKLVTVQVRLTEKGVTRTTRLRSVRPGVL
jgi:prepilin-type N-terminal cleavage/methylation domain-containing protein